MVANLNSFVYKNKKIMSWAEKCFHLLLELPNKPFKWSTMPIPWLEINCWKSENAKMTQNGLSSPKCIFWLQPYRSFKKSTRNLRGINYQMEHMWWAPHKHKNSLRLQWGSQLHCTLYRSFIATLYLPPYHHIIHHIIPLQLYHPMWYGKKLKIVVLSSKSTVPAGDLDLEK